MRLLFILVALFSVFSAFSQAVNAPHNRDYYHLLERLEVRSGEFSTSFHASMKPYNRKEIAQFLDSLNTQDYNNRDLFNYQYLKKDSWEWSDSVDYKNERGIFGHIYKTKPDFLNVHEDEFDLHVNPVLHLSLGEESISDNRLYTNTRGLEVRGLINNKLGFYTFIGENQVVFPYHVNTYIDEYSAVPAEGFWKPYGDNNEGVDFFTARGYISFQATKNINLQFGHDRFFIGNGERSFMLSDFATGYLFLKAETNIWNLNYTNLFGLQTADVVLRGNQLSGTQNKYPRKFLSLHHLSYNITNNINIGIFEAIMSGDSSVAQNPIDPVYFNPIIFYRAIEQQDGSSGNALVGMDFRALFLKRFSLYGQLVLDEFLFDNLKQGGWWANKWAVQTGLKYFNAFEIPNLDFHAEYNVARPFMYAHDNNFTNYANYKQPLAHPLGANFEEYIATLRYQIAPRIHFQAKAMMAKFGTDTTQNNHFGGDVFKPNNDRYNHINPATGNTWAFGHTIGQGESNTLQFIKLSLSVMPYHNLFLDLNYSIRKQESQFSTNNRDNTFLGIDLRWNIPKRENLF